MTEANGEASVPALRPARFGLGTEVVAVALVLAYSVAITRVVPAGAYAVSNLAAAALAVAAARVRGVSLADMGLEPNKMGSGLRVGLVAAAAVAGSIALLVAVPGLRHLFAERDAASPGDAVFQVLVRIPLGTALPEELIFRGALLGLFMQRHTRTAATAITSVLFGLWHVFPTIDRLAAGASGWPPHGDPWAGAAEIGAAVAATTVAGFAFAWLRFRSGSVVAPVLAHASFDSCGLLAARFATAHPA